MARRAPAARAPRLLPLPVLLGAEPDAFAPTTEDDDEQLASLVYLSGANLGQGDSNTQVSNFIASMSDSIYSQYMDTATTQGKK